MYKKKGKSYNLMKRIEISFEINKMIYFIA